MRSTTVGWLTSIVRVLPAMADHMWLNSPRPESRDSISQPTEPTKIMPNNSPNTRANTTAARDRAGLEDGGSSDGIQQGYHPASEMRRGTAAAKVEMGTWKIRKNYGSGCSA